MKLYIIHTTTGNEWEITGGIYLVNAYSIEDAKGRWLEQISSVNPYVNETITHVEEYTNSLFISQLQEPIIE